MKKDEHTTGRLENILQDIKTEREAGRFLDIYTDKTYDKFHLFFNDYMAEHQLILSQIIERSNISKNYAYNIVNGDRKPGRDKIIALCIGAGMGYRDINRALKVAKEGILYPRDRRDARIIIAVNRGIDRGTELNLILEQDNLKIIE